MGTAVSSARSPLAFFASTLVLTIPFWVLGTLVTAPGGVPMDLPWAALAVVAPVAAALALAYRTQRGRGVRELLRRTVDPRGIRPFWYMPAILFMPAVVGLSAAITHLLGVAPRGSHSSLLAVPVLFAVYVVAASAEEVGWTGYATDPACRRWGVWRGGALLGLMWAAVHLVPWLQVRGPMWTAGYALFTVAARMVMVWLYRDTGGSVVAVILLHAMINTSGSVSPYTGSPSSPYVWTAVTVILAAAVLPLRRLVNSRTSDRQRPGTVLPPGGRPDRTGPGSVGERVHS